MKFRNTFVLSLLVLLLAGTLSTPTSSGSAETTQGDVIAAMFDVMGELLAMRADQYGVDVDVAQAKLFQLGQSPAVIAPITSFNLSNLGLVGLLEAGGPFEVGDTQLPAGSYRLELSGRLTSRQLLLNLRDEFGARVASVAANQVRMIRSSQPAVGQANVNMSSGNPLNALGLVGPTIGVNIVPSLRPPFIREIHPCIGFLIPVRSRFLSFGFCL